MKQQPFGGYGHLLPEVFDARSHVVQQIGRAQHRALRLADSTEVEGEKADTCKHV